MESKFKPELEFMNCLEEMELRLLQSIWSLEAQQQVFNLRLEELRKSIDEMGKSRRQ